MPIKQNDVSVSLSIASVNSDAQFQDSILRLNELLMLLLCVDFTKTVSMKWKRCSPSYYCGFEPS